MSKIGNLIIEMEEAAQTMSRAGFLNKYGNHSVRVYEEARYHNDLKLETFGRLDRSDLEVAYKEYLAEGGYHPQTAEEAEEELWKEFEKKLALDKNGNVKYV